MSRFSGFLYPFDIPGSLRCPTQFHLPKIQVPDVELNEETSIRFLAADGSRPLTFPQDFGAHEEFRTEWWYYTGNLQTPQGRHFGFELTIFRVGLLPPTVELPDDSEWYDRSVYFAHFAVSDIAVSAFMPLSVMPVRTRAGGRTG